MKRKNLKKKKFPWEFFTDSVQFGTPKMDGMYVCFYKPYLEVTLNSPFPMAGMTLLNFSDGKWGGTAHVLAFIGPLPSLSLDELALNEECLSRVFYIGTLKEAVTRKYKKGPYNCYEIARAQMPVKNNFIIEVNSHKTFPNPVSRPHPIKEGFWKKLKKPEKYIKIIERMMKNGGRY